MPSVADHLSAIVSSSEDAIFSKTLDGVVTTWNGAAQRLYGYSEEEAVGRHISFLIPSDRRGEEVAILAKIATGERVEHYETQRVTKDGVIVDVALTASPIRGDDDRIIGASVIARDIRDQKLAEQAINEARSEAERANRAKSEFLSRMSHELRTPLSAILGFAELLNSTTLDDEQRELLGHVMTGGSRLRALINEVLDISRIEAGQFRLSLEPVPLAEVISEDVALIKPLADQRAITVQVESHPSTEGAQVKADRQRLSQVLLNLLSNAVKYNVEGGSVTIAPRCDEPGVVRIAVADTGPGIPGEKLDLLFDPFERLDADETNVQGTGLGLTVAKGLVEAMGGRLFVDSTPGRGTVFYVELQLADVEATSPTPLPLPPSEQVPAAAGRVLYIEDNAANIRLVRGVLRRRPSVELLSAMTAAEGLEIARRELPDLILLDRHLPDGNGEDVLAMIRRDPATHDIPTVIASADAFQETVDHLKSLGAADYLTKPFDFDRFLDVIDRFVTPQSAA